MHLFSFTVALLLQASAPSSQSPEVLIIGRTLSPTPIAADLEELVDGIGGRPTGSAALDQAIDWAIAKLKAAGLENVRAEDYTSKALWLPGVDLGEVTFPRAESLRVAAMPFSTPTAPGGLEAEVVDASTGDEDSFAALREKVKGRWVLIHTEPMKSLEDLFKEYLMTDPIFARARAAGAAGVLWMSNRSGRLLYRHNVTINGAQSPLHAAVVEREAALHLARMLRSGRLAKIKLRLSGRYIPSATARNVVAEIRGREAPDEMVIFGAHLDSWDLGRGALDNGCNVAMLIDSARQIAALKLRARRTLRFVLYTGEEDGMWGSMAEARSHRAQLDNVKAQIVFDIGSGRTTGFSLGGRADVKPAVDAALAPVAILGPFTHTVDAFVGTDNYDYLLEGVPTLVANQEGAPYLPDYHAESDTFDKVDLRELKSNTAIAAVLMFGLANGAKEPAPRQSRSEIEALVARTGLDQQMKTFGLWDEFARGERGRAPHK
jgi:carboxypeptidase Q